MPQDLLHALVPTYPPYESATERSGSLDGAPHSMASCPHQAVAWPEALSLQSISPTKALQVAHFLCAYFLYI